MIKKFFSVLPAFFLTACAAVNIPAAKPEEAISMLRVQTYVNNDRSSFCRPAFSLAGQSGDLQFDYIDGDYFVFQTPPGTIRMTSITCTQYRVLFVQERTHVFANGPSFRAAAGHVNYAGTAKVNYWVPGFTVTDLVNAGTAEDDDGRIQVKAIDNYKDGHAAFLKEYKKLPAGFTFKKSLLDTGYLSD